MRRVAFHRALEERVSLPAAPSTAETYRTDSRSSSDPQCQKRIGIAADHLEVDWG